MYKTITKYALLTGMNLLLMTGTTACGSLAGLANTNQATESQANATSSQVMQSALNGVNAALSSSGADFSPALVKALDEGNPASQESEEEDDVVGEDEFNCQLLDSEGNEIEADDFADFDDIATVICESSCNDDGSGTISTSVTFNEDGTYAADIVFNDCDVETCDTGSESVLTDDEEDGLTASGEGSFSASASCAQTLEMEIEVSDGSSYTFDLTVQTEEDEDGYCAEAACTDYAGTVTVDGDEVDMNDVCEAMEATDECSIGDDESDEEGDDESDEDLDDGSEEGDNEDSNSSDEDEDLDEELFEDESLNNSSIVDDNFH